LMTLSAGVAVALAAAMLGFMGALVLGLLFRAHGNWSRRGPDTFWTGSPWEETRNRDLGSGSDTFIGGGGDFGGGGASGRW
jgi:uncharacterized protein